VGTQSFFVSKCGKNHKKLQSTSVLYLLTYLPKYLLIYLRVITYSLHGAESFLRS